MSMCLSSSEITEYRNQGYLIPRLRIRSELLSHIASAIQNLINDNLEIRPEQIVCPHIRRGAAKNFHGDKFDFFWNVGVTR